MKEEKISRKGRWGRRSLALALSVFLAAGSVPGAAAAPVPAETATTDVTGQADVGTELDGSKDVSELISDTWDDTYFGTITVDTV